MASTGGKDSGILPFVDEFGGYSSRMRVLNPKYLGEEVTDDIDVQLCDMLGIDVEAKARALISPCKLRRFQ